MPPAAEGPAAPFALTMVTDRRRLPDARAVVTLAGRAARAGVDLIQVREKDLEARVLAALVRDVRTAVAGTATRVLVNGRPDVALAAGADGVQLPEDGLPVAEVRREFPSLMVGASCHSVPAARRAGDEGAHFVVLGPIFPTPGKEDRPLGLEILAEACAASSVPVHAIGGVEPGRVAVLRAAGARGGAAIRPFLEGPPDEIIRAFRAAAGREGR